MRDSVRILLVGESGVGKSSIITCLIRDAFVPTVQHVVPELRIPPECTRDNVTTRIIDSSSHPENRDQLESEINKADVICVVYAVDRMETFQRIPDYWLPYIRNLGRNVPIVLVGNKIDLRPENATGTLESLIAPIMNDFREVESCVECSAKENMNVPEVFYFAQKAVLHPTAPLYDSREHTLKIACVRALTRIFHLCDLDKDGHLNNHEINEFQSKCFDTPLQNQELETVEDVVRQNEPSGFTEEGLTEVGFLFLHKLFIQRGRLETTWTVLRKFGYDDDLSLRQDFLEPKMDVPLDCAVELSSDGIQFFTELFQKCDQDKDGALKESELTELFKTAPSHPWIATSFPDTTVTDENGAVTLQGFLAQWSMTTFLSYKTTLAYLAYLGYPHENTTTALNIVKPRKVESSRFGSATQRNVFLCYVLGATGSGKTSLMRGLIGKKFQSSYSPTLKEYTVVNALEVRGVEKELVMEEIGPQFESQVLQNKKRLAACDIICLVYDSGDANSFAYVAGLRERYKLDHLPCVFVATKSDTDLVPQRYNKQPDVYCRDLGLPVPISISMKQHVTAEVYRKLIGAVMEPSSAMVAHKLKQSTQKWVRNGALGVVSIGLVAILVGVGLRYIQRHNG